MPSFDGVGFDERGGGGGLNFPVWSAEVTINQILIPGGAPVLQGGGRSAETLDLALQCTLGQYNSLKAKKGSQGVLVLATGSFTAVLQSVSGQEITANAGIVQGTAKFLKVG